MAADPTGVPLRDELQSFDLFVFDLDGVVYRGPEVIPGAVETIQALRALGKTVAFNTNNSTRTRETYETLLTGMGIPARAGEIYTSAYLVSLHLQEIKAGARVYVVGEAGFQDELRHAGFTVVNDAPDLADVIRSVDFVVAGLDRGFEYAKLKWALWAVQAGATFFASNDDPTLPMPDGDHPGAGTMVAAIANCTGAPPSDIIGKPNPNGLELLSRQYGVPPGHAVMVGDRIETDILAGNRAGFYTVFCAETGARSEADLARFPDPGYQPDLVLPSIREFLVHEE